MPWLPDLVTALFKRQRRKASRLQSRAWRIAGVYAAISILWIVFSDQILTLFVSDQALLLRLSVYKGVGFVIFTSLLLLLMMRRTYGAIEAGYDNLKQHKQEIERGNRLYSALSHINQSIVAAADRQQLFDKVSQSLVNYGGFRMAWIGTVGEAQSVPEPLAWSGDGTSCINDIIQHSGHDARGINPWDKVINDGVSYVCNDVLFDPLSKLWRHEAIKQDLQSFTSLPLRLEGKVCGVLSVYANEPEFFCKRELSLLEEVAIDVSFGLESFRMANERYEAETTARQESQFSQAMLDSMPGIVYFYNEAGHFLRWNKNFETVSGYSHDEVAGMHPLQFFDDDEKRLLELAIARVFRDGEAAVEASFMAKNGSKVPYFFTGRSVRYKGQLCLAGVGINISDRIAAEDRIEQLAFYDPLTGLPNRRLMQDRLQHSIATGSRQRKYGALLFIDLDNFKTLNDTKGHNIGDNLLTMTAQRLNGCVREGDTVARFGGDEFVVILESLSDNVEQAVNNAEIAGEKILRAMSEPYPLQGEDYHGSASVGVSLYGDRDISAHELIRRADTAMYQAKRSGRNTLYFYDPAMQAVLEARLQMETDLRLALEEKQFCLYYQPQVDNEGNVVGAEALIRWMCPTKGLIPPGDFIPLAEEAGLIVPIGNWVLNAACRKLKAWENSALTSRLQLAVNVSARQFHQDDFVRQVLDAIATNNVRRGSLKLELTESLILDNVDSAVEKMNALGDAGVRFSMDDFGTGYSSLSYLTQLPLHQLKIDQSFVHKMLDRSVNAVIVQTIIGMANNLEIEVIAEGVETTEQFRFLKDLGCPLFQGYHFGKPVPEKEFEKALSSSPRATS